MRLENPYLEQWERVCAASVIGRGGHRLKFEGGPAHPVGHAPCWVTSQGVNMALLHAVHSATMCQDFRGCEDSECGPVVKRSRRRKFWLVARRVVA